MCWTNFFLNVFNFHFNWLTSWITFNWCQKILGEDQTIEIYSQIKQKIYISSRMSSIGYFFVCWWATQFPMSIIRIMMKYWLKSIGYRFGIRCAYRNTNCDHKVKFNAAKSHIEPNCALVHCIFHVFFYIAYVWDENVYPICMMMCRICWLYHMCWWFLFVFFVLCMSR